jgi:hypothetical protein
MKLSHGVAAGAEDSKYQAKYRVLKKKVKELETVSFFFLSLPPIFPTTLPRIMTDYTLKSSKPVKMSPV